MSSRITLVLCFISFCAGIYAFFLALESYTESKFVLAAFPEDPSLRKAHYGRLHKLRSATSYSQAVDLALVMAEDQRLTQSERLESLCNASESLLRLSELRPSSGYIKSKLAYIEMLLVKSSCKHPKIDPEELIKQAQSLAPFDHRVLLFSARVFDMYGRREGVYDSLKRFFLTRASPSFLDRAFVYEQIEKKGTFQYVFPMDISILSYWLKNIASEREDILLRYRESAISQLRNTLQNDSVALHEGDYRTLFDLYLIPAFTHARQQLAEALANYAAVHKNRIAEKFFRGAASRTSIDVIPGFIEYDSKPTRNPLRNWLDNRTVALNSRKRTFGVFVVDDVPLSELSLIGLSGAEANNIHESLQVFSSRDNQEWVLEKEAPKIDIFSLMGRDVVSIKFPENKKRYWKIHYSRSVSPETFHAYLPQVFQASGRVYEN